MFNSKTRTKLIASLLGLAVFSLSPMAFADSGPFLGGSVGTATVSADVPDPGFGNDINFDETATIAMRLSSSMPGIGFGSVAKRINCFLAICRLLDS